MSGKIILFLCVIICVSVTACAPNTHSTSTYEKYEEKTKEELGSLTDDEKRILSRGGYFAKDRIYASQLYDNEIEKVKKIRGAKQYLKDKYPNQTIKINLYESRGENSKSPTGDIGDDIMWISENGENTLTWVKVKETGDGYEYYDNWDSGRKADTQINDEITKADFTGVVNPVNESSYDEIKEIDGLDMKVPSASLNKNYARIVTDAGVIGECSFDYGNSFYVYRMKKTLGPEDISGTYYNWTYISEYNMPNKGNVDNLMSTEEAPTIYGNNDGQGLIIWYKDKISYSIFMPTKANDEKLFNMYKTLE